MPGLYATAAGTGMFLQEAAAALSTRYQEQRRGGSAGSEDELRQPISASEVDEASNMVFQRSPAVPSGESYSHRYSIKAIDIAEYL